MASRSPGGHRTLFPRRRQCRAGIASTSRVRRAGRPAAVRPGRAKTRPPQAVRPRSPGRCPWMRQTRARRSQGARPDASSVIPSPPRENKVFVEDDGTGADNQANILNSAVPGLVHILAAPGTSAGLGGHSHPLGTRADQRPGGPGCAPADGARGAVRPVLPGPVASGSPACWCPPARVVAGEETGGPLVNLSGEAIEINVARTGSGLRHTGFAVPIDTALAVAKRIQTAHSP